jgi:predicted metalloprotease with PDZ domain
MNLRNFALLSLVAAPVITNARNPLAHPADAIETRFDRAQPVVRYTLRIDGSDLSGYSVEMHIRNASETFRVAMVAHEEYDDRFWRYVESLRVESANGAASLTRQDSAVWQVRARGGEVVLHYRIHLPAQVPANQSRGRAAWRPYLTPAGGLVGGPHSFMYIVGATLAPSFVTLELPAGWRSVTGLEPTLDPSVFLAPSTAILVDSPVLVGLFKSWPFTVDGVPHRLVYWPDPPAAPFDTAALLAGIKRLVNQDLALFGRLPYREYSFIIEDSAYGALEHLNSVTIGAPSAGLARSLNDLIGTVAHEYFHSWNLMRLRPGEYGDVDYLQRQSRGLWWSEGLTMFYADLTRRRAGLPVYDSTRAAHLAGLMGWYLGSPGNSRISPERVSVAANSPPGLLGDYSASTHLQGELIGTMLDLTIRDATGGRQTMDDVMRLMFERFSGRHGFTGRDIERAVADISGTDVHPFFEEHVRGEKSLDFDRYLRLIGLRSTVTWGPSLNPEGRPAPDLRVYAWQPVAGAGPKLGISEPSSCWGKAGLHTGDLITAVNGAPVSAVEFRALIGRLHIGDSVNVEVKRAGAPHRTSVVVSGYESPVVRIEEIQTPTARQRSLRDQWAAGIH